MDPFVVRYAELRASIASKAGVTTGEADVFLNLGRPPISLEADHKLQHPKTPYSSEERRFIADSQSIASNLNRLQMSPDSVIPVKQKKPPAKRTKDKESLALDGYIRKHATKPNKELLVLARAKFPGMDITLESLKMRKTRLRNKSEG